MKLELKSLKVNRAMSEETTCFSATLYVNGKKVAEVSNRGTGGSNDYRVLDKELYKVLTAWAGALQLEFKFDHLDQVIDRLIDRDQLRKDFVRGCKTQTIFLIKAPDGFGDGTFNGIKRPFDEKIKKHLQDKYQDKLLCIVNEDIEKAIDLQYPKLEGME